MMIYKSEEYYKGRISAFENALLFAEEEMENAEMSEQYNEAEVVARWLREAIRNEREDLNEACKAASYT